jgi:hypothetical protein
MRTRQDAARQEAHNEILMHNSFVAAMLGTLGFVSACLWVMYT